MSASRESEHAASRDREKEVHLGVEGSSPHLPSRLPRPAWRSWSRMSEVISKTPRASGRYCRIWFAMTSLPMSLWLISVGMDRQKEGEREGVWCRGDISLEMGKYQLGGLYLQVHLQAWNTQMPSPGLGAPSKVSPKHKEFPVEQAHICCPGVGLGVPSKVSQKTWRFSSGSAHYKMRSALPLSVWNGMKTMTKGGFIWLYFTFHIHLIVNLFGFTHFHMQMHLLILIDNCHLFLPY